ncbi:transcription elongation factor subunit Spt4 [Methanoculleus oceani]|uniref:Transcription elongation factor Spt4 n=1 Tax=Methanoculleus oceani TaxID=2184756 RepID=A0ABD4TAP6_9EURY|nr:transcription elongation factor subunit Spt4 [Methanoculleus sp. CWC-02]MCM2464866.1 DNA-directed RNA polymerase subunit E'' [Methanoculleus sp. CWC-02]
MVVRKKVVRVCRECHRVVEGESCVVCGTANLSEDWAGYVVIIDPEHSEIAKKMNITMAGRYALKVR